MPDEYIRRGDFSVRPWTDDHIMLARDADDLNEAQAIVLDRDLALWLFRDAGPVILRDIGAVPEIKTAPPKGCAARRNDGEGG